MGDTSVRKTVSVHQILRAFLTGAFYGIGAVILALAILEHLGFGNFL